MKKLSFRIKEENIEERLDKFLAKGLPSFSRSYLQKLIKEGYVYLNTEKVRKTGFLLKEKGEILVEIPPKPELIPESFPLEIIYEDSDILVISKKAGLITYSPQHLSGTLINALLNYLGKGKFFLVHRLDKDTSGVLLVAKNEESVQDLKAQFKARKVKKTYLALVEGHIRPEEGIIEAPIGRSENNPTKMSILPKGEGRQASTRFKVKEYLPAEKAGLDNFSFLEVIPHEGRTHQIRVHLSSISHPILGDKIYGSKKQKLKISRQFLHAWKLKFRHPKTKKIIEFKSELPSDLQEVLGKLQKS